VDPTSKETVEKRADAQNVLKTLILDTNGEDSGRSHNTEGIQSYNSRTLQKENIRGFLQEYNANFELNGSPRMEITFQTGRKHGHFRDTAKFEGLSFTDIFKPGSAFSQSDKRQYTALRVYQSLQDNNFNNKVSKGLEEGGREINQRRGGIRPILVRFVDDPGDNIMYNMGNQVTFNLSRIDDFFEKSYKAGINIDEYLDMTVAEELIHSIVYRVAPQDHNETSLFNRSLDEMKNSGIGAEIAKIYTIKNYDPSDSNHLYIAQQEFVRAAVQQEFFGYTTEDVGYNRPVVKGQANPEFNKYIKNVFKRL